jgi:uncharacterized protein YkwD
MGFLDRLIALFSNPKPIPPSPPVVPSPPVTPPNISSEVFKLVDLHNSYRLSKGLRALNYNQQLSNAAYNHTLWMISRNDLDHYEGSVDPFSRMKSAGYVPLMAGAENIAYNSNPSVNALFNQWVNSPPHNRNILGNYKDIGVGIALDSRSRLWGTICFGSKSGAFMLAEGILLNEAVFPPGLAED